MKLPPVPDIELRLASLTGENVPPAPPPKHIGTFFDTYAEKFDAHLTGGLQYQAPQLLFDAVMSAVAAAHAGGRKVGEENEGPSTPSAGSGQANSGRGRFDVLDLGCGTGLAGALFRPISATLA